MQTIELKDLQVDILERAERLGLASSLEEAVNLAIIKMAIDTGIFDQKEVVEKIRKDLEGDGLSVEEVINEIKRVKE